MHAVSTYLDETCRVSFATQHELDGCFTPKIFSISSSQRMVIGLSILSGRQATLSAYRPRTETNQRTLNANPLASLFNQMIQADVWSIVFDVCDLIPVPRSGLATKCFDSLLDR